MTTLPDLRSVSQLREEIEALRARVAAARTEVVTLEDAQSDAAARFASFQALPPPRVPSWRFALAFSILVVLSGIGAWTALGREVQEPLPSTELLPRSVMPGVPDFTRVDAIETIDGVARFLPSDGSIAWLSVESATPRGPIVPPWTIEMVFVRSDADREIHVRIGAASELTIAFHESAAPTPKLPLDTQELAAAYRELLTAPNAPHDAIGRITCGESERACHARWTTVRGEHFDQRAEIGAP